MCSCAHAVTHEQASFSLPLLFAHVICCSVPHPCSRQKRLAALLRTLQCTTSWRGILVQVGCDRQPTQRALILPSNYQTTWGTSLQHTVDHSGSACSFASLHCVTFCPCPWHSPGASSVSSPLVLQLLYHMRSGRSSAAFVVVLTDGNRNSSTNRPILWLTGEQ